MLGMPGGFFVVRGPPPEALCLWVFRFLRPRGVQLENPLEKQGSQQHGQDGHEHHGPPFLDAENGSLRRQQHHHNGAGQVGGGKLEGHAEQPAHAVVEPPQEGKQPAQHPRREDQREVIGHVEKIGPASQAGPVPADNEVPSQQQQGQGNHDEPRQQAHFKVLPEGAEIVPKGPALPSPDALYHRIVQRRRGRTDGGHRKAEEGP